MDKVAQVVGIVVIAIAGIFALSILTAIPVWLLWNWLCPILFQLSRITLMQAWGLSFLCGMLFKGSCTKETKS